MPDGERPDLELHNRNCIDGNEISRYTKEGAAQKIAFIEKELEEISRYGHFSKLGKWARKNWRKAKEAARAVLKATGSRRIVKNNGSGRICVTGNKKRDGNGVEKKHLMYLSRGRSSESEMYDADGIIIQSGQLFYISRLDMMRKKRKYSSGVIKVKDIAFGVGNAEVADAPGEKNTYYVNSLGNSHHSIGWAKREEWKVQ